MVTLEYLLTIYFQHCVVESKMYIIVHVCYMVKLSMSNLQLDFTKCLGVLFETWHDLCKMLWTITGVLRWHDTLVLIILLYHHQSLSVQYCLYNNIPVSKNWEQNYYYWYLTLYKQNKITCQTRLSVHVYRY